MNSGGKGLEEVAPCSLGKYGDLVTAKLSMVLRGWSLGAFQGCCLKPALLSDKLSLTDEVVAKLRGKATPG